MTFWIICGALTAIVALAIALPLLRGRAAAEPAAAFDLRVYRDQLREVDRDLERGIIGPGDAERLRTEIGRKVLDADRRMTQDGPVISVRNGLWAGLILLALIAGAVALYLREGAPGAPDLPLAARFAAAQNAYDSRPSQDMAERDAQRIDPPPAVQPDPQLVDLMDKLREAVAKRPDDIQGLTLLARNEARLGNLDAAMAAQSHLIEVMGDGVTSQALIEMATLMIQAAGGLITPEAEQLIAEALQKDADNPQARYMVGLLQAQNGRPDRTFPIWAALLEQYPGAPWAGTIRDNIDNLAWLAGQPDYVAPAASPVLPGPDADTMAAAADMSPEDRQQMIAGMVAQLENRLAEQGGTPEEWARLISSLAVLGNTDHARDIWAEAQARFGDDEQAIAPILAAAQQAGIAE